MSMRNYIWFVFINRLFCQSYVRFFLNPANYNIFQIYQNFYAFIRHWFHREAIDTN